MAGHEDCHRFVMGKPASRNNNGGRHVYTRVDLSVPGERMRPFVLAVALLAALSACVTQPLPAQLVTGQVVDSNTGTPVGAGFVVLLDASGREIARTLSSRDGHFTLRIPPNSREPLRVRSERIGYRVAVSDTFRLAAASLREFTLAINALPVLLSTIEVRDETECRTRPAEHEQTAVIWEEIRKALAAASWTASHQRYRYLSNLSTRTLDERRRKITEEVFRPSAGVAALPFQSAPPEQLADEGYIVERETFEYFAPDAQVLQSEQFLSSHCFRIVRDSDSTAGLIGLAFEPTPSRRQPDVAGVLWLDQPSAELRRLEYRYTNHPYNLRDVRPGGTVEFMAVPSGAWIVHRWEIRAPFLNITTRRPSAGEPALTDAIVTGFHDVGGEVLTLADRAGDLVYEAEVAEVTGVVVDSLQGGSRPLVGAVVQVANSWFADTTDFDGRFHLKAPLDGEYGITFSHPKADSLGYDPPPRQIRLARGRADTLSLTLPPLQHIVAGHCPSKFRGPDYRVLVGTVRHPESGLPVAGARVMGSWQSFPGESGSGMRIRNRNEEWRTGDTGQFTICGLEVSRPVMLSAGL